MSLDLQGIGLTVNNQTYLNNIDVTFESGAFNVLLGRTLAGKTSLMRVIAGLDKPTRGKLVLNGEDITRLAVQRRNVSMVYQQFINYPHMTVWENIASPLQLAKVPAPEVSRRVTEIAELLHIDEFLQRLPIALSGGQQQRCAMARALVKDAQIILFDEPLVNLDYKLRETLRFELKAVFKQRDSIAIYATTEAHEALALGGTTTLLHQGSVLQHGDALAQFYRPTNLDAADLYHEPPMNRFVLSVKSGKWIIPGTTNLTASPSAVKLDEGSYQCAIRPDQVNLVPTASPEIAIKVRVDLAEISASETFLHVTLNESAFGGVSWVVHLQGIHNFHYDSVITLYVTVKHIFVFDQSGISVHCPESTQLPQTRELG